MLSLGTSYIADKLKKGRILETANLSLMPTAAVAPAAVGVVASASSPVLSATAWATSQFFGAGVPLIGMVNGGLIFAEAFLRLLSTSCSSSFRGKVQVRDVGDLLFSLPIIIKNYEAWGLHLAGAAWQLSLAVVAQGYAIKAAYDFIKAAIYLADNCDSNGSAYDAKSLSEDMFLQGLKFTGFVLLGMGPTCFTAGFIFLTVAAVAALCICTPSTSTEPGQNRRMSF